MALLRTFWGRVLSAAGKGGEDPLSSARPSRRVPELESLEPRLMLDVSPHNLPAAFRPDWTDDLPVVSAEVANDRNEMEAPNPEPGWLGQPLAVIEWLANAPSLSAASNKAMADSGGPGFAIAAEAATSPSPALDDVGATGQEPLVVAENGAQSDASSILVESLLAARPRKSVV